LFGTKIDDLRSLMILNCYKSNFRRILREFADTTTTATRMKIDPYCQGQRYNQPIKCTFQDYAPCVDLP